ncbi:hypothetical protein ACH5RR_023290 [Cinchona calisaya]|uniref:Uncharacterized protein n=1 Tax=Cinchona calisaya TaxID=153742 RepID=A0ABD2ZAA3_9GENT
METNLKLRNRSFGVAHEKDSIDAQVVQAAKIGDPAVPQDAEKLTESPIATNLQILNPTFEGQISDIPSVEELVVTSASNEAQVLNPSIDGTILAKTRGLDSMEKENSNG